MSINTDQFTYSRINTTSKGNSDSGLGIGIPIQADQSKIIDSRRLKDFKEQAFGGYNRANVSSTLEKALISDKLEPALHWVAQLLSSGVTNPLWEKLCAFSIKYINIYNPKLPEFIYNRTLEWYKITDNPKFTKDNILHLRNHPSIRLLLAEIVSIIILSKKRKINILPKIKKEEFIIDHFKSLLEAPNTALCEHLYTDGDPSEIRVAINEMAYQLQLGNSAKSLYWLSWITEWEHLNTKKYGKYECGLRTVEGVDGKWYKDVVWFIWMIINKIANIKFPNTSNTVKQIVALYNLYKYRFTVGAKSRKNQLIIYAMLYITEMIDWQTQLIDRPNILYQNLLGYDKVFAAMKAQQVNSGTPASRDLMNIVVENNYMITEKHKTYEDAKQRHIAEQQAQQEKRELDKAKFAKLQLAKQKKINVSSLDKLSAMSKLDKILNNDVF